MKDNISLFLVLVLTFSVCSVQAQDSTNVELAASLFNQWDSANDLEIIDNLVFVTTGNTGLSVIDITNIENPTIINTWDAGFGLEDIVISGEYAYVKNEHESLCILTISDPENICLVNIIDDYIINGFLIEDDIAYVGSTTALYILSINDPENPSELSYIPLPIDIKTSMSFQDDYLYVLGERTGVLSIFLVSDPNSPELVRSFYVDTGHGNDISISGDTAYLAYDWGLRIISITNPENPYEINRYECYEFSLDLTFRSVGIYENYALITGEGLRVISIENHDNLVEVTSLDYPDRPQSIFVTDNYIAVAGGSNGINFVTIDDQGNLEEIGGYNISSGNTIDLMLEGDYLFTAKGSGGLSVVSTSNPDHPVEIGNYYTGGVVRDIDVLGNYAFVAEKEKGLKIISIEDPENPEIVGSYTDAIEISLVAVSGDYLYAITYDHFTNYSLSVISISDPSNPEEIASIPRYSREFGDIVINNDYLYMTNGVEGLRIISIADPYNPHEVFRYYDEQLSYINDIYICEDIGYITCNAPGFGIISLSDPTSPQYIGSFSIPGAPCGLSVFGDYAYVAANENGIRIISISDPENPEEVGYYQSPGTAKNVVLSDQGLIYLADHTSLGAYRFTGIPNIRIAPTHIDFGENNINEQNVNMVEVNNPGTLNLEIQNITIEGTGFYVDFENPLTLESDSSITLPVTFIPLIEGGYEGSLIFHTNIPDREEIYIGLQGTGIDPEFIDEKTANLPGNYSLSSTYPNPFNSTTRFSYSLPNDSHVKISVYNLHGQEVEILQNAYVASGTSHVCWNGQGFTSGIYFIKMESGNFRSVVKTMLLK